MKKKITYWILHLFYPKLLDKSLINTTLLKYIVWQKILGINRHVPWPTHFSSQVKCPEKITNGLKETPGYSLNCYIDARNGIILENDVYFGPRVSLISMNHDIHDLTEYEKSNPIIIRNNTWLATNCIILAGVELGPNTIVAAGAIVTKSFPNGNQILAGNPAKVIRELSNESF